LGVNEWETVSKRDQDAWDYFMFQTSGSGEYTIQITIILTESADGPFWLFFGHDVQLAINLCGPDNYDNIAGSVYRQEGRERFFLALPALLEADKTYYLKVFSQYWEGWEDEPAVVRHGEYKIIVKQTEVIPLSVNAGPYSGDISYYAEHDWYSFTAAWSGVYTIETHQQPGRYKMDTAVFLYGPDNQTKQIYFDYDSGADFFSKMSRTLDAGHTYYVKVIENGDDDTGYYDIDVLSQKPTPRPTPTRPPITIATPTPRPTLVLATPTRQLATPTPPRLQIPTFTPTMTPTPLPVKGFLLGGGTIASEPGARVRVPINVRDLPNTAAISLDVVYDVDVLAWGEEVSKQNTLLSSWNMVSVSLVSPGRLLLGAAAFGGQEAGGDGTLAILTFNVSNDAKSGILTEIMLENLEDGVANATPLPITVSIQTGMSGDVDGNGRLTAGDAQMAFEIFMRRITPTDRQQRAADVNKDGKVTATDAQMIFEAFMGGRALPAKRAHRLSQATSVSVGTAAASPGEEVTVPIYVTPGSPITALAIGLGFNNTQLTFLGFDGTNTLLENFAIVDASEVSPGNILIGAAAFGADPISTSGVLINLRFRLHQTVSGPAPISITSTDDDLAGAATADGGVNMQTAVNNWPYMR
jgi:hypothetical protein